MYPKGFKIKGRGPPMMERETDKKAQRLVLIITTLASVLTPLALSAVTVALPSIAAYFSMDAVSLSWLPTAYVLTAAIVLIPIGKLSDIYGRKRVFVLGTWIFTITSFLLGISTSGNQLIGLRVVQGFGGAMLFGPSTAMLTSAYPPQQRGRVLGINVAAVYLGLSFGPLIGGLLTQSLGWRSIFFLNVPLGLFIALLATWGLKGDWTSGKKESLDFPGSLILGGMFFSLMYGFSRLPNLVGMGLIAFSGALLWAFICQERRAKYPVLDLSLFVSNRPFTLSNLAALINYAATFAIGFVLTLYLQHLKGMSPRSAGLLLAAQPLVQAVFSPLAGRLSDRRDPGIIASTGMGITACGLLLLAFIGPETSLVFITGILALLGFGFALFTSPNTNAIMSAVDHRFYGVAASLVATMRSLGQMASMAIAMLVFALYMGRVPIVPEHYGLLLKSTRLIFSILGILCAAGVAASMARGKVRN
jgi:EmrB/QacA subfamily drug resistance transporter